MQIVRNSIILETINKFTFKKEYSIIIIMKVITSVVNNPDFIEIQYHTLKKYLIGDFEFIVFNDAKNFKDYTNYFDSTIKQQIIDMCNKLNIKCINIPNDHHQTLRDVSVRASQSLNYMLEYQKNNLDKYLVLDSDMFLIDYYDVTDFEKYSTMVVLQTKENEKFKYFWNGIYYFDMLRMNNLNVLNWNCCRYCDTGGMTMEWLKTQLNINEIPTIDHINKSLEDITINNIHFIKRIESELWDLNDLPDNLKDNNKLVDFLITDVRNVNGKFFCEIYDNKFLHYRSGANWRGEGLQTHKMLTEKLKNCLLD